MIMIIVIIIIMTDVNNSSNKNHTYRLINVLRGANIELLYMCCLGLKFGMVWLGTCIEGVKGFPYSNIIIIICGLYVEYGHRYEILYTVDESWGGPKELDTIKGGD